MAVYRSEDTVQLIKETAGIAEVVGEHVTLRRSGANLKGLCPFHSEKTPSFTVNPDRGTYHCFGCGEGGDVISFMMNFHRLTFAEALRELARKYNISLPEKPFSPLDLEKARKREALHAANEKAASLFQSLLLSEKCAQKGRDYLEERGVSPDIIREFRLGFAPDSWSFLAEALAGHDISAEIAREAGLIVARDKGGHYDRFRNRVMFPIFDLTGMIAGFGGRILDDGQPKYMNSPESLVFDKGRTLFGMYQNREHIRSARKCIVVEGNFDLISLAVHGVRNVVAPLGTALTQAHVRSLKGYVDEVVLLFDGDQAGLKAAMRSVPFFLSEQVTALIAVLPPDHDPDTFVRQFGRQGLARLLAAALPLPEFACDRLIDEHGLTVAGKAKIVEELRQITKTIDDQHLQRTFFVSHFSKRLGFSPQQLLGGGILSQSGEKRTGIPARTAAANSETLPMQERQLLEFLVVHPEYLQDFLDTGLEDIVVSPFGAAILQLFAKLRDRDAGPEQLLDLATGPERSFISGLLTALPTYSDELKKEMAREKTGWLRMHSLKAKRARLVQQINKAQQTQNEKLLLELMIQKKIIDETMRS